ncbi:MAG: glycosyltransferase family 4 protein [Clostridia bacterium]|nr:glycosyltransferase family 4 protein [Clostridia bacterium]
MKVTFYSNFLNHHQLPFCLAMDRLTGGQFTFVATMPVSHARIKLGYHDMNKQYPFVLTTYDSPENQAAAMVLAQSSDVIITGSAPEVYTESRIQKNKLTFRYSERIYKEGLHKAFRPRNIASRLIHHTRFANKPLYMLCASAYTPFDYALTGSYMRKTFKWGYFPEVKHYDVDALMNRKRKGKKVVILWVARFLSWKHPEAAIEVAERLKKAGIEFEMQLIGNGELEANIKASIQEKGLSDCVHMLGAMSPEEVRDHMEAANIFLFTSDFNEGWGAVLNESMNSGCAVVASHAIGSVPFLLEDGKNGFIYKNGDIDGLYNHVVKLIEQPELREQMGSAAYQTLADQWNADVAAERFLALAQALIDGKKADLFKDGPCSRAKILKNGWYKND